jgi:peptidoglycan hydrolase CwlO-like protein
VQGPVETTELPPNPDLEKKNHELELLLGQEQQIGHNLQSQIDSLSRKINDEKAKHAKLLTEKERLEHEAEERRKEEDR